MMESLYLGILMIAGFGLIFKLFKDLEIQLDDGLIELDEKLALAIKSVVDSIPGMGETEAINPIQMAFAQMIAKMGDQTPAKNAPPTILERDDGGLFAKQP